MLAFLSWLFRRATDLIRFVRNALLRWLYAVLPVKQPRLLYFAYGSNMFVPRLRVRVASAEVRSTARLIGYALRFHKRSEDRSGKCNAFRTGDPADEVYGVLFAIDPSQKADLDRAEGLGNGYVEATVQVISRDGEQTAFAYLAEPGFVDDSLRPYTWYKKFVVRGARESGLPQAYVDAIEAVAALRDPNPEREKQNLRILGLAGGVGSEDCSGLCGNMRRA